MGPGSSAAANAAVNNERNAGAEMSLGDHLRELRTRVIRCAIALVVGTVIAWIWYADIFSFLAHPYCVFMRTQNEPCTLVSIEALDQLQFRLQVCTYGGLFLASPVIFFQLWRFIAPGLYKKERRYATAFVGSSLALFVLGAFCAYITMPKALDFLLNIGGDQIQQLTRVSSYISLLLFTMLAFAAGFQFPILLIFLQLTELVSPDSLARWRREAIVGIALAAAILTPSVDPFSMFALAIPMYGFYEASILIGRLMLKRRAAAAT